VTLSIVVTTYNRSAVLKRLLAALDSGAQRDFQAKTRTEGRGDIGLSPPRERSAASAPARHLNIHRALSSAGSR